jgi:hypothetical protein
MSSNPPLRPRDKLKCISTEPGFLGAGESETQGDELVSIYSAFRLPLLTLLLFLLVKAPSCGWKVTEGNGTASSPLIPPNTLQQRLTPLLFESSRLLSIVPSVLDTISNL